MRPIAAFKITAIAAGVFISLACGGILGAAADVTPRTFYVLNVANGAGAIGSSLAEDTAATYPIDTNVPFGTLSAGHEIDIAEHYHTATVTAVTGPFTATSPTTRSANPSVVIAMNPAAGPVSVLYPIHYSDKPSLVFIKDGSFQGVGALDIYVTAPGVGIITVAPDGTLTENGVALTLQDALHANTDFQVRLTKAGTKDVVFDFGTSPGVVATHYRVYALYHNATAEQSIIANFDSVNAL